MLYSMLEKGLKRGLNLVCIAVLAVLAACASAPVQEMSDARQALSAAAAADAERYSPEQYDRAKALLRQAESRLNNGAYNAAKRYAVDARFEAMRAREAAIGVAQRSAPALNTLLLPSPSPSLPAKPAIVDTPAPQ